MNTPFRNSKDRWIDDNMARDPGILKSYYCHILNTLNPRNLNGLHSDSETVRSSDTGTNLTPISV